MINEKVFKEVLLMRIAVVGKMRAGKDSVGDILKERFNFQAVAFGDGIKKITREFFPEAYLNGKPREHYQHIGQELRKLNPDVWVNYTHKEILNFLTIDIATGKETNVIVTDCRQKNEEAYLRRCGFKIVKVVANDEVRLQRIKDAGETVTYEQFNHGTEQEVDTIKADYIIFNHGAMCELERQVIDMYTYFQELEEMNQ